MADGEHTHGNKHLSLDDVQMIIGRAMVDENFRAEFTSAPETTLKKLHISLSTGTDDDEKARTLIMKLAEALSESDDSVSMPQLLKKIRDSYLDSADGVLRPRCG